MLKLSLYTRASLLPRFGFVLVLAFLAGCNRARDSDSIAAQADASHETALRTETSNQSHAENAVVGRDAESSSRDEVLGANAFSGRANLSGGVRLAEADEAEAIFHSANEHAAAGKLDDAILLLETIPQEHPQAGLPALGQAADWCLLKKRYADAEKKYLEVLKLAPEAAIARRQLAYLYNRQGRRHEAAEQIQHLCRLGEVTENELHGLISVCDAIFDDPSEPAPKNRLPHWPIGPGGDARKLFTNRQYAEAAAILQQTVVEGQAPASINALYGRCLAESQQEGPLLHWLENCDSSTIDFSEYWSAWGTYLVDQHRFDEAVRTLGEALRRDPTDRRSIQRIVQALTALGKSEEAKNWNSRFETLYQVTKASNQIAASENPEFESFNELTEGLVELGRPLEAVIWNLFGAFLHKRPKQEIEELNRRRLVLIESKVAFGNEPQQWCGMQLTDYPLPKQMKPANASASPLITSTIPNNSIPAPQFENIAPSIGIDHCYRVASKPQDKGFAIYQQFGGGVAVLDYDLDGFADLYFAQGGSDPPTYVGLQSNVLYRTINMQMRNVTAESGATEYRYSIGVTAGDWNQDGFPDLVIANLGANTLLINNGDGTFRSESTDALDDATLMSTSLGMADVNGDALPDIVEINYLHDPKLPSKPKRDNNGNLEVVGPLQYAPAMDRLLVNDSRGDRTIQHFSDSDEIKSTGLGLVICDFDGRPGNEVFVGNDLRTDSLWSRDTDGNWTDLGSASGCAFGYSGAPLASMGIAAGDIDGSGTLDLFITNFENEPNSLFLRRNSTFQDRSFAMNLAEHSIALLGFGTQPIDFDLDGRLDLVVTNGNVENHGSSKSAFEQPPQFFVNLGNQFALAEVIDASGYFSDKHVGRALATLDFNHDGKTDFVITHLESPTALLINQTNAGNHWLNLELVGTKCERDAIGATIQVHAGEKRWTGWVIAGNGYLCRNESVVSFGLSNTTQLDDIVVHWPDGETQRFLSVPVDSRVLLIQGEKDWFCR